MKSVLNALGALALTLILNASMIPAAYSANSAGKSGPRDWPPTNPLTGSGSEWPPQKP